MIKAKVKNILFPVARTIQNLFDDSIFFFTGVYVQIDISATNEKKIVHFCYLPKSVTHKCFH